MATESISPTQRAECIKLQAERVVRAYNDLRTTAHSADFKNDDFPVGRFAELVQQIKLLDGWLQPVEGDAVSGAHDVLRAAGTPYSDVSLCVEQAKALTRLISSDESEDIDSIQVAASMASTLLFDAEKHLTELWVAIGGKPGVESDQGGAA